MNKKEYVRQIRENRNKHAMSSSLASISKTVANLSDPISSEEKPIYFGEVMADGKVFDGVETVTLQRLSSNNFVPLPAGAKSTARLLPNSSVQVGDIVAVLRSTSSGDVVITGGGLSGETNDNITEILPTGWGESGL